MPHWHSSVSDGKLVKIPPRVCEGIISQGLSCAEDILSAISLRLDDQRQAS